MRERNGASSLSGRLKSRCKLLRRQAAAYARAAWPIHEIWHASPVERENARNNATDARVQLASPAGEAQSRRGLINDSPGGRNGLTDSCIK